MNRSIIDTILTLLLVAPGGAQTVSESQPVRTLHTATRQVGAAGIHVVGADVVLGLTLRGGFRGNDVWVVMRRSASTGNYDEVWASPLFTEDLDALLVADVAPDPGPEVLTITRTGSVQITHLATRRLLSTFTAPITRSFDLLAACVADLDGDLVPELLLGSDQADLQVYSLTGSRLWSVPGVRTRQIVVAEMDGDPGREIVTTDGKVIDAATRAIEWTIAGDLGTLAAADVDQDGKAELFWRDAGMTRVVDVDLRTVAFSIPWNGTHMQIADIDGNGVLDIVFNNYLVRQAVFDLATRTARWTGLPLEGPFALGDPDGDGRLEIVTGTGRQLSPANDRLHVIDARTGAIDHQRLQLEGPFEHLRLGELDGDAEPELLVQSSGRYARQLVLDARTLAVAADTASIYFGNCDLYDLDRDGRHEVFTPFDGLSVQRFDPVTRGWTRLRQYGIAGQSWQMARVADVDGDGVPELLAMQGPTLHCFDLVTGQELGRSRFFLLGVTELAVADTDGDGIREVHVLSNGDVYLFRGRQLQIAAVIQYASYPFQSLQTLPLAGPEALLLGDARGDLRLHLPAPGRPLLGPFALTAPEPLHRLETVLHPIFLVLTSDGRQLAFHDDVVGLITGLGRPVWRSDRRGSNFGRQHILRLADGAVFTTSDAGVFRYEPR